MYYTYILRLNNVSYYHGYSDNLKRRFQEHQDGQVRSTKDLRPLQLIFYASFLSKDKAIKFEKYLKSSSGYASRNKHLL